MVIDKNILRVLICVAVVACLPAKDSGAITANFLEEGAPENDLLRLWLPFTEGVGTRANSFANYHLCTTPAYSPANFEAGGGVLGGASGSPSWVAPTTTLMPSLDFTRANRHHLVLPDNSSNCTTGNDPWDHTLGVNNDMLIGAWIKPEMTLTCSGTPPGTIYNLISKWDEAGGECSYKMWLEVVDGNRGSCDNDRELVLSLKAAFNDDSTNFSCASPCEISSSLIDLPTDSVNDWVHVGLAISPQPSGQTAQAFTLINGQIAQAVAKRDECADTTNIPESVGVYNSTANLYIGKETAGDTDAFEGKIADVTIMMGSDAAVPDSAHMLFHADMEGSYADYAGLSGGGGFFRQYMSMVGRVNFSANGRYGKAVSFASASAHLRSPTGLLEGYDASNLLDSFSVEAWIKPGVIGSRQTIISQWQFDDVGGSCVLDADNSTFRLTLTTDGKLNFAVAVGSSTLEVTGQTTLTVGEWYHVTGMITPDSTLARTADSIHLLLNGVDDLASPLSFASQKLNAGRAPLLIGASNVTTKGEDVCGSEDGGMLFFTGGSVDEVRINRWLSDEIKEQYDGGIVINEVGLRSAEEIVELYYPSHMKDTINLAGWTLSSCTALTKQFTFDESCGGCVSRDVDPGDIVRLKITDGIVPMQLDTSCAGAATSCLWTTDSASTGTNLVGGDIHDTNGGVVLYRGGLPADLPTAKARMVDAVLWADATNPCNTIASSESRGLWQYNAKMEVGLITGAGKTLCLPKDGNNSDGVLSWAQCNASLGSLNSSSSTAIDLLAFDIELLDSGEAKISFQTGSEINTFGFNVLGADISTGVYVEKSNLIMARGGAGQGALYEFFDPSPSKFYKLKETEVSGLTNFYGPFTLTASATALAAGSNSAADESADASSDPTGSFPASSQPVAPAAGCGSVVAKEGVAPGFLALFLVLVILGSTRTHFFFRAPKQED